MPRLRSLLALLATSVVWTASSSAQGLVYRLGAEATSNSDFGRSVGDAGDVDHDGVPDLIVGAPFSSTGGGTTGAVFVYSGRTGALLWSRAGEHDGDAFGWSVDGVGDLDGDGASEVIASAPLYDADGALPSGSGKVYVFSPATDGVLWSLASNGLNVQMGRVVRGLGDVDGDGVGDFAMTSDGFDHAGLIDCGAVFVFSGASQANLFTRYGSEFGEHFGYSLDVLRPSDWPVVSRIVVGAPQYDAGGHDRGRVYVLDGYGDTVLTVDGSTNDSWLGYAVAGVGFVDGDGTPDFAASAPYTDVLFVGNDAGLTRIYSGQNGVPLFSFTGEVAGARLGEALAGFGDMDGDGKPDLLIGSPEYDFGGVSGSGEVRVVSGANGATLASFAGGLNDSLGRSVSSAGDLNGDGTPDFLFGAPDAPHGEGQAEVHLSQYDEPTSYCTAMTNSQGCAPSISYEGAPSTTIADFHVVATNVLNHQPGILLWGRAAASTPFMGGTLCVAPTIVRTPPQNSGGNPGAPDCSGSFTFHFSHVYMAARGIFPGDSIFTQYWSRDPAAAFGINLTDALHFEAVP